jgi:hypothetical protein
MIKFNDFLNESKDDWDKILEENSQIFEEFLEHLSDYMDLAEKSAISKLFILCKGTSIITKTKKVYRVMCQENDKDIDFGSREMISTSTSKIKGKTLDTVIGDMKDRYEHHKGMKDCKVVYVEIPNVQGINIYSLITQGTKKGTKLNEYLDDYYIDMFKRLKSEKEFLAINNNLKASKIEEL